MSIHARSSLRASVVLLVACRCRKKTSGGPSVSTYTFPRDQTTHLPLCEHDPCHCSSPSLRGVPTLVRTRLSRPLAGRPYFSECTGSLTRIQTTHHFTPLVRTRPMAYQVCSSTVDPLSIRREGLQLTASGLAAGEQGDHGPLAHNVRQRNMLQGVRATEWLQMSLECRCTK